MDKRYFIIDQIIFSRTNLILSRTKIFCPGRWTGYMSSIFKKCLCKITFEVQKLDEQNLFSLNFYAQLKEHMRGQMCIFSSTLNSTLSLNRIFFVTLKYLAALFRNMKKLTYLLRKFKCHCRLDFIQLFLAGRRPAKT